MKKSAKLLACILTGVGATLFLTLTLWGHEWYKMIASIAIGAFVGLLFNDAKGVFTAFVASLRISRTALRSLAENIPQIFQAIFQRPVRIKPEPNWNKKAENYATKIIFLVPSIIFIIIVLVWRLSYTKEGWIQVCTDYTVDGGETAFGPVYILLALVSLVAVIIISFIFLGGETSIKEWSRKLPSEYQIKFWGRKIGLFDRVLVLNDLSWKQKKQAIFKTVLRLQMRQAWKSTKTIAGIISVSVTFLVSLAIQSIIVIAVFLPMMLRELYRTKNGLLVAAAVTVGGLIGTWHLSYLWGFGSAIAFAILCLIIDWVDKKIVEIKPIYVWWSKPYTIIYGGLIKTFFKPAK